MTTVTQAEFARLKGWHRSSVTRARTAGRLVMVGDLVDVEASEARLAGSSGGRDDVAERHAAARNAAASATEADAEGADTGEAEEIAPAAENGTSARGESRADAQARKESALADLAELDFRQKMGQVLPRADVEMALDDLVSFARSNLENLPHRMAAQLIGKDYDATLALLKQEVVTMMAEMHKDARQKLAALTAGEGGGA